MTNGRVPKVMRQSAPYRSIRRLVRLSAQSAATLSTKVVNPSHYSELTATLNSHDRSEKDFEAACCVTRILRDEW
jgi:hypothetical protein